MIRNLIFDFGKVLVDYDYYSVLDKIFATHSDMLSHNQFRESLWCRCKIYMVRNGIG
jgi:hypothetical protein